jgi:plastocyanin
LRKLLAIVLVVAAGLMAILAATALAATKSVKIGDNYFVRPSGVPTVKVRSGTKVKWVWRGRSTHNVTVRSGPARFHSTSKTRGSFSKTLRTRGTYVIYCSIHGRRDQSMKLVVR